MLKYSMQVLLWQFYRQILVVWSKDSKNSQSTFSMASQLRTMIDPFNWSDKLNTINKLYCTEWKRCAPMSRPFLRNV